MIAVIFAGVVPVCTALSQCRPAESEPVQYRQRSRRVRSRRPDWLSVSTVIGQLSRPQPLHRSSRSCGPLAGARGGNAPPPQATAAAAVAAVRPAAAAGLPPGLQDAFTALAGAQVRLATSTNTVSPNRIQPERHFLSPYFVTTWTQSRVLPTDPFFCPIFNGAAATLGGAVVCRGQPVAPATPDRRRLHHSLRLALPPRSGGSRTAVRV